MDHDVCETMGAGVTVYADFVDFVIDFLWVSCQRSVMTQRSLLRCTRSASGSACSE